jgi:PAS domain-containing protein
MELSSAVELMTLSGGALAVASFGWRVSKQVYNKFDQLFKQNSLVMAQLLPNGGSSLRDAVDKLAKEQILTSEHITRMYGRQRMIMDALDFGTIEFDKEGNCIDVNEPLLGRLNLSESDFSGSSWLSYVNDKDFESHWRRAVTSKSTINRRLTFIHDDKVVPVLFISAPSGEYHFARLLYLPLGIAVDHEFSEG